MSPVDFRLAGLIDFDLDDFPKIYPSRIYRKVVKFGGELRPLNIKVEREEGERQLFEVVNKFTKHYLSCHRGMIHQKEICKSVYPADAREMCFYKEYYDRSSNYR